MPSTVATELAQSPLLEDPALREIRRANLQLLTSRPGTKTQLARLTDLSAANVSHRLHGEKIFDRLTADFFCAKLGMPAGWFDEAQTDETIPAVSMELLLSKDSVPFETDLLAKPAVPPRPAAAAKQAAASAKPAAPRPQSAVPAKKAVATPPPAANAPVTAQLPLSLSGPALGRPATLAPSAPTRPAAPVAQRPVVAPVARPAPAPAPVVAVAPAAQVRTQAAPVVQAAPAAGPQMTGPIVEALIRTLALKTSEGRISEERALQLLVEVASL